MSKHFHGTAHFKGGFDLPYIPPKSNLCKECGKFAKEESGLCWVCSETKKAQAQIVAWKMENYTFHLEDQHSVRVFEGTYKACEAELNRLIEKESGYWYMYDETDPNEAWQSGGDADLAEAAKILDWLPIQKVGEFPTPARAYAHQPDERDAFPEGCGYDPDMPNYARGG